MLWEGGEAHQHAFVFEHRYAVADDFCGLGWSGGAGRVERAGSRTAARYSLTGMGAGGCFGSNGAVQVLIFSWEPQRKCFAADAKRDSRMGGLWLVTGKRERSLRVLTA